MEAVSKVLAVAAGGAFGSVARYLLNLSPLSSVFDRFPFPTFVINVLGSFLIGLFLILLTDRFEVSDTFRLAVTVGFIGAFTTFSTFEMEIYGLIREGHSLVATGYIIISLATGFLGLLFGIWLGRQF
ncbi:fluoride efflux transporter CrcB [Leptolyngbya sp. 7M]|uniref:fluoride efflux transporter CrcB n=1 Tax=Leptolyngbya sp. 7M TaxID=2812896 RepID=UPI001B8AC4EA|nr:fluoride efflux transporter CrcB [Leptolyngbya sp. 7M]QYO66917.1 fluoride efflux transporter CrcB [Leptolyngbya sp. 7M]